jgi:hypothetical protein
LNVPETVLGKKVRCPMCQAVFVATSVATAEAVLPADEQRSPEGPAIQARPEVAPPGSSRRRQEEDAREDLDRPDEERERRPRRRQPEVRKRSSGVGLWLGLAGGLLFLMLAACAGLGWFVYSRLGKGIAASEWQAFSPPGSGCSVQMPGVPQPQPLTGFGPNINKYVLQRPKDKVVFMIATMDLGANPLRPSMLDDMVAGERNLLVGRMKATVQGESPIQLGALPGRELRLSVAPRGSFTERIYLVKVGGAHRVYIIAAGGDYMAFGDADAARFFASFKIDGNPSPPTYAPGGLPGGTAIIASIVRAWASPGPRFTMADSCLAVWMATSVVNPPGGVRPPPPDNPRPKPPQAGPPKDRPADPSGERPVWRETNGQQTIALAVAPDNSTLAVGHWHARLRLWDMKKDQERAFVASNIGPVHAVAFNKGGSLLALGGSGGKVAIWGPASVKEQNRFQLKHARAGDGVNVTALTFSPDGKALAVGLSPADNSSGEVHLWDLANGRSSSVLRDGGESPRRITFLADGALAIVFQGKVMVWAPGEAKARREFRAARPEEQVVAAAVSVDGKQLATLGVDRKLKRWDLASGECLRTWAVKANVNKHMWFDMKFSPDGKTIVLGALFSTLHFWDAQTGKELKVMKLADHANVDCFAISGDGRFIALHCYTGARILAGALPAAGKAGK